MMVFGGGGDGEQESNDGQNNNPVGPPIPPFIPSVVQSSVESSNELTDHLVNNENNTRGDDQDAPPTDHSESDSDSHSGDSDIDYRSRSPLSLKEAAGDGRPNTLPRARPALVRRNKSAPAAFGDTNSADSYFVDIRGCSFPTNLSSVRSGVAAQPLRDVPIFKSTFSQGFVDYGNTAAVQQFLDYIGQMQQIAMSLKEQKVSFSHSQREGLLLHMDLCTENRQYMEGTHYQESPECLGGGSYGQVFLCVDKTTGTKFVTKKILIERFDRREVEVPLILAGSQEEGQRAMLKLYGVLIHASYIIMFMEPAEMDWDKFVKQRDTQMTEQLVVGMLHKALTGLSYMHRYNIFHMDIKPANLGIRNRDTMEVVFLDYGSCYTYQHPWGFKGLTPKYAAPEVYRKNVSGKADVWSLGCTAIFLLTGKHVWHLQEHNPFDKKVTKKLDEKIEEIKRYIPDCSNLMRNLIVLMLEKDPEKRISTDDLLQHQIFSDILMEQAGSLPAILPGQDGVSSSIELSSGVTIDGERTEASMRQQSPPPAPPGLPALPDFLELDPRTVTQTSELKSTWSQKTEMSTKEPAMDGSGSVDSTLVRGIDEYRGLRGPGDVNMPAVQVNVEEQAPDEHPGRAASSGYDSNKGGGPPGEIVRVVLVAESGRRQCLDFPAGFSLSECRKEIEPLILQLDPHANADISLVNDDGEIVDQKAAIMMDCTIHICTPVRS